MALESKRTKEKLHASGKSFIHSISHGYSAKTYRTTSNPEEEPLIPSPAIFDIGQHGPDQQPTDVRRLPVAAACATHLELLEVFYVIRQKILMSKDADASFGIEPKREKKTGYNGDHKTLKDSTLLTRRQVKWPKYIEFAAVRFINWVRALEQNTDEMTVIVNGARTLRYLPPLDVVMVWHSFMLNPRLFMENCQNHVIHQLRMPWKLVHQAIDNRNWTFTPDEEASNKFEELNSIPPNLFDQFESWHSQEIPENDDGIRLLPNFQLEEEGLSTIFMRLNIPKFSESKHSTRLDSKYFKLFKETDARLAVQLRDAVIRQSEFVDKMNARMWVRSPALEGTLRRAIGRYDKFLTLMRLYPKITVVPTLDIDLVWHTHQCTAVAYVKGMKAIVGRFINHDDTIVKEKLGVGFDITRGLFRVHFAQEYRVCGCWDCEALTSELEIACRRGGDVDMAAITESIVREVRYHQAVEVAIRGKKPLPIRN